MFPGATYFEGPFVYPGSRNGITNISHSEGSSGATPVSKVSPLLKVPKSLSQTIAAHPKLVLLSAWTTE